MDSGFHGIDIGRKSEMVGATMPGVLFSLTAAQGAG
jgi:hypothetical protein